MTISVPGWVKDAVFYQIFPDRFARSQRSIQLRNFQPWGDAPTYHAFQGGDLYGVVEKLDYLVDLGVNAIWLNPIFASSANHRYHTNDYFQIDPILGGMPAFCELIDQAHRRDIRIVLDGVFNHTSRGFFQFNHLMENGRESPYRDWFYVYNWPVNAYNEQTSPSYAAWWGMHALPKLNTNNPQVREFLWDVGTYWLEQGIDGWRLDVPNEIDDDDFWREFRRRCRAVNGDCYIVGELWGEAHRWLQGDQFDAQMNYMFSRAVLGFIGRDRLNREEIGRTGLQHIDSLSAHDFAREINRINNHLYDPEIVRGQLNVLGTHDTPRLATLLNEDSQSIRLAIFCQMTMPGAPNLYYGDEIGLPGRHDPDCRRAFPWQEKKQWDQALLADVRRYAAMRHATPALRRGDFTVTYASQHVVVYKREHERQTALIALNAGQNDELCAPWPDDRPEILTELLAPAGMHLIPGQTVTVNRRSARVWVGETKQ